MKKQKRLQEIERKKKEKEYYQKFLEKYENIAEWHKKLEDTAIKSKIVRLPSGREYYFPNIYRRKDGSSTQSTAVKNYPVQGFATADIVPIACINVWNLLKQNNMKTLLINTVHDSVILDVHPEEYSQVLDCLNQGFSGIKESLKERFDCELSNLDSLSNDKIMAMVGQDADMGGSSLARLSINYEAEDSDGNAIKRGLYKVEGTDKGTVYAEKVSFRPFLNTFQYKKYDEENEDNNSKSVMFRSWSDSKIDTKGTESCGSVPKAQRDDLDPASKIEQDKVTCYRNVFGVVSAKGKTSKGQDVTITEEPVLYRVRGVNFLPIGDQLKSLSKRNKIMYNTVLDFNGTEKHTKGSVTYFTAKIKDANKDVKFSDTDKQILKDFLDYVKQENDYVKAEHDKAKKSETTAEDILDDEIMKEVTA